MARLRSKAIPSPTISQVQVYITERSYSGPANNFDVVDRTANVVLIPGLQAYELYGSLETIVADQKYFWAYDPYNDNMRDDIFWDHEFYVVVTDGAGNVSISKPIQFENIPCPAS